ncbi:FMN-linked oxidoreductase [Gloeophyllum trabeum ATCC 11539]|uniref:tRNA-dihydrouridine(47) synthase [NAD(P)(+)] n=1 Tax=Gloeophyllum trabeum (strain ATCC 11539 / FP-39264 / Madison 617) TaxID=670483 RepID=S7PWF6_GLOTA|nr:FMN-linked oxidoreductase [Gloeophyllum trabeum ATCC 11539]EPQ51956.1 FMN-linked oxidoreductase [Gloeophyllum trabeum ATCC 11539]
MADTTIMSRFPPGTAPVKEEYLISFARRATPDDDAAEGSTNPVSSTPTNLPSGEAEAEGGGRKLSRREKKKKERGQNKGRRFQKVREDVDLCWRIARGTVCEFGDSCRQSHDVPAYLSSKPQDLSIPPVSSFMTSPPFVHPSPPASDPRQPSLDLNTVCPVYAALGECRYGLKCRFLGAHVKVADKGEGTTDLELVVDEEKKARAVSTQEEMNKVDAEVLKKVRTRKYPTPMADAYSRELQAQAEQRQQESQPKSKPTFTEEGDALVVGEPEQEEQAPMDVEGDANAKINGNSNGHAYDSSQTDTPDVPIRFQEKKRLRWEGKSYLAPLTTTGNLPFRRLCVSLGADITCGEMGLAQSFLQGSKEEWSLVRRHPDEKIFGIQLAGSKPNLLVPTAEILANEFGRGGTGSGLDFVDLNCGCPIDLVFKQGSGSALLDAPGRLGKILIGMNRALGEVPLTIKLRTGVKEGKNTVHKLMERACGWGVSAMTLHGRTRQQRYTKLADWDYIKQCVELVRAKEKDEDLPPIPIFGNGDVFSAHDYYSRIEQYGVDGVMIGRGALIKPWIFTEIAERREWDISSRERLELIRRYAEYGLSHFGTDTAGLNTARRYLCEALSFQYRYVPIGLLEVLPPKINDRPPAFRGRDELETLLASGDSRDWVKISEMFLGPAPETWSFTPKHKSNAYGNEEAQG